MAVKLELGKYVENIESEVMCRGTERPGSTSIINVQASKEKYFKD